jgi:Family of unknown function (DUF5906)/Bifunctional DNA primase/polymerase, N-terminal
MTPLGPSLVPDLIAAGYGAGLLPVAPPGAPMSPHSNVKEPGKVPTEKGPFGWRGVEDWPDRPYSVDELQRQIAKFWAGLGLATTAHPYIDCDVTDPALSDAIERALAPLLQFPLKRVGRAPKFAIPCRWADDAPRFGKMVLHLHDAAGQSRGMIEVLGERHFVVLAGSHPKTKEPYRWYRGGTEGSAELLAQAPPASLPPISADFVANRMLPAVAEALHPFGVTVSLAGRGGQTAKAADVDQATLLAPSLDDLTAVVSALPNEADHEAYVTMGRAIRAAAGEEHLTEGLALFEQWSSEGRDGLGGSHPPRVVWESLDPPHLLGWDYLLQQARAHGYNTGSFAFEANPAATPGADVPPYVADFNRRYALVRNMAGTVLHLAASGPEFLPLEHWRTLTAPEKVDGVPISKRWVEHSARRVFRQVTMDPARPPYSALEVPGDAPDFNIWPGFAVEASTTGSCELFLAHLRDVVCSGDAALYRWVLGWLAAMIQAPAQLTGTALVLRGPMGSGKSYVGEVIGELLGARLFAKVSKPDELTGRFNSHHQGKLLLQVEEGFFAGNHAAVGALKHMITSDRVRIEQKFRDSFEIPNYCRLLITSNESWVIPAGLSERRFTVVDVSGARKDDYEYHAAMRAQMSAGGYAKLMHVLREIPLDFKLLSRPCNTAALRDQQLASLDADRRWLYDLLQAGAFPDGRVEVDLLYRHYVQFLRDHSAGRRADRAAMGRLVGSLDVRQAKLRQGTSRVRAYAFPPLTVCRDKFAADLAASPEWEGPSAWPTDDAVEAALL